MATACGGEGGGGRGVHCPRPPPPPPQKGAWGPSRRACGPVQLPGGGGPYEAVPQTPPPPNIRTTELQWTGSPLGSPRLRGGHHLHRRGGGGASGSGGGLGRQPLLAKSPPPLGWGDDQKHLRHKGVNTPPPLFQFSEFCAKPHVVSHFAGLPPPPPPPSSNCFRRTCTSQEDRQHQLTVRMYTCPPPQCPTCTAAHVQ